VRQHQGGVAQCSIGELSEKVCQKKARAFVVLIFNFSSIQIIKNQYYSSTQITTSDTPKMVRFTTSNINQKKNNFLGMCQILWFQFIGGFQFLSGVRDLYTSHIDIQIDRALDTQTDYIHRMSIPPSLILVPPRFFFGSNKNVYKSSSIL
jgi:hypothetical protein